MADVFPQFLFFIFFLFFSVFWNRKCYFAFCNLSKLQNTLLCIHNFIGNLADGILTEILSNDFRLTWNSGREFLGSCNNITDYINHFNSIIKIWFHLILSHFLDIQNRRGSPSTGSIGSFTWIFYSNCTFHRKKFLINEGPQHKKNEIQRKCLDSLIRS